MRISKSLLVKPTKSELYAPCEFKNTKLDFVIFRKLDTILKIENFIKYNLKFRP